MKWFAFYMESWYNIVITHKARNVLDGISIILLLLICLIKTMPFAYQ